MPEHVKLISAVTPKNELNTPCPKCGDGAIKGGRFPYGFCCEVITTTQVQTFDDFGNPIGEPREVKEELWHCPSCGFTNNAKPASSSPPVKKKVTS